MAGRSYVGAMVQAAQAKLSMMQAARATRRAKTVMVCSCRKLDILSSPKAAETSMERDRRKGKEIPVKAGGIPFS
jgi:hypothetical protein